MGAPIIRTTRAFGFSARQVTSNSPCCQLRLQVASLFSTTTSAAAVCSRLGVSKFFSVATSLPPRTSCLAWFSRGSVGRLQAVARTRARSVMAAEVGFSSPRFLIFRSRRCTDACALAPQQPVGEVDSEGKKSQVRFEGIDTFSRASAKLRVIIRRSFGHDPPSWHLRNSVE